MSLANMSDLLAAARNGGYALCYCESWNLESLQAVLEAAEEMRCPTIVGFNGGFLGHPCRSRQEDLAYYAAFAGVLKECAVPVAFLLNETDNFAQIEAGIALGFNAVMVENHSLGLEDYRRLVKEVVKLAHKTGVSVEAQIGHLPDGCDGGSPEGELTNAELARAFVNETGIDALGVSVGNIHIQVRGKAAIDLAALERIRNAVDLPLVIHGGTGFPQEYARRAIDLSVAKFNFGTNLKQTYLCTLQKALSRYAEPMNPHPFLGMGGSEDIMTASRRAVKEKAKELIQAYGYPDRIPGCRTFVNAKSSKP